MASSLSADDMSALAETLRNAAERLSAAIEPKPRPNAATYARLILAARRRISTFIDADLFADPARDILLDLFVAGEEGTRISISSCCIAAAVPPTTALRWIKMLKKRGLVHEAIDPADGRRKWLSLSADAHKAVRDYVLAASGMFAERG
ncbi:MAG TPA: MarR family transcriptional regulator [Sphingomonas sp.]|uniref:MarR family transcriptional regulator n=1 Tax=Sphingomonas sp. TaxID=28214 RepID=UPI002B6BB26B|nr:MarR family transcriptional regulator [Sphingomonas sp.]HMI18879.1 MarR family transcriptional regulator [Sphingomonas sp.]